MILTDYTSYAEVRAVCGLSSDELTDTELELEIYSNALDLAVADIDLTDDAPGPGPLGTRFLAIDAIAVGSRTAAETKLYNLTRMFCTYVVAREAIVSLSVKAAKTVSDSKSVLTRFSPESVYKDVIKRIDDTLSNLVDRIEGINSTTSTTPVFMGIAEPTTDVVTGA